MKLTIQWLIFNMYNGSMKTSHCYSIATVWPSSHFPIFQEIPFLNILSIITSCCLYQAPISVYSKSLAFIYLTL